VSNVEVLETFVANGRPILDDIDLGLSKGFARNTSLSLVDLASTPKQDAGEQNR
jgi:hypothetical protein